MKLHQVIDGVFSFFEFKDMRLQKIFFLFLLFSVFGVAQTKVGGKVVDEFGEPIPFANVIFKNSKEGVITDENGSFYFESKQNYSTLQISFIGFEKKEIL